MARTIQVVFDCRDPTRLSEFYAAALHYKLQDPPEGFATWEEALKAAGVAEEEWNSASAIVDPDGRGPRIYFQQMDTPKQAKNRVHLDLNASGGSKIPSDERKKQIHVEVDRLLGLGATKQQAWEELGGYWVVMLDPEGNEFCVQ
ncbi:MAG: VOC family protein [Methanobacteriota archaeon]